MNTMYDIIRLELDGPTLWQRMRDIALSHGFDYGPEWPQLPVETRLVMSDLADQLRHAAIDARDS